MRLATATLIVLGSALPAAGREPPLDEPPPAVRGRAMLRLFARGLTQPVGLVYAPGDPVANRLFVVEKIGRVRAILDGVVQEAALLDVSGRVSRGSEQGLLGLAFHPKWAENGRLFVNFTDKKGHTHVIEFRVRKEAPGRVDPAFERELLFVEQPYANHNGGDLVFGPDGKLYIGLGDGGSHDDPHGNGQRKTAQLGKMLRLDVDAPRPVAEIHMLGLRNPWRYVFDRATGDLYIADVGQNKYEEVDVVAAADAVRGGQNFGWAVVEGLGHCHGAKSCYQTGLVQPVVEYTHQVGCSITGGYVYRGKALPQLDGIYFYADYCTAAVRGFRWRNGAVQDHWDWKPSLDPAFHLSQISTFGEDAAGELYLVSLEGTIWKLVPR